MSFTWSAYLDLAHALLGLTAPHPHTAEAVERTAISRAYYATYGTAMEVAQAKDGYAYNSSLRGLGMHEDLIQHFLGHPDRRHKKIGTNLGILRNARVEADYHAFMAVPLLSTRAVMCCQIGIHTLDLLARL